MGKRMPGRLSFVKIFSACGSIIYRRKRRKTDELDIGQAACDTTKDIKAGGKVFTGGDMVNGGKTVVQAVAEGKDAAAMIAAYLNK